MKIDVEQLRAILTELGVEPEKIEAAIAALGEKAPEEIPEGESVEESTSSEAPVEEELPADAPVAEEEPVAVPEEEIVADPESVPEAEAVSEDVPPVELPPEAEGEIPPAEEPVELPPAPPVVSVEEFEALKADYEETKKALEGLKAANESLKEALTAAGVIDGASATAVGIDKPSAPGHSNISTTMDDVLAEINRKGY